MANNREILKDLPEVVILGTRTPVKYTYNSVERKFCKEPGKSWAHTNEAFQFSFRSIFLKDTDLNSISIEDMRTIKAKEITDRYGLYRPFYDSTKAIPQNKMINGLRPIIYLNKNQFVLKEYQELYFYELSKNDKSPKPYSLQKSLNDKFKYPAIGSQTIHVTPEKAIFITDYDYDILYAAFEPKTMTDERIAYLEKQKLSTHAQTSTTSISSPTSSNLIATNTNTYNNPLTPTLFLGKHTLDFGFKTFSEEDSRLYKHQKPNP